jgi:tRNA G10  N-methylase Trm11
MFYKNIIPTYKPLLFFAKGTEPKTLEFMKDSFQSQRPDKTMSPLVQSTEDAEYMMSYLTIQNDVVLDPLMGTGTTGIAAIKLNRKFVGIDKDTVMLQKARYRISELISSDQKYVHNAGEDIVNYNSSGV